MERHVTYLTKILSGFDRLDRDPIAYMASLARKKSVKKHTTFFQADTIASKLYFVAEGIVMQRYIDQNHKKATSFHFEGDFVTAYESFLHQIPSEYSLQTLEDTTLLYWTLEDYQHFLSTHPKANLASLTFTQELFFREYQSKTRLLAYPAEKLYKYLVKHEPRLLSRVPLFYIAEYMGISHEYLSRLRKKIMET